MKRQHKAPDLLEDEYAPAAAEQARQRAARRAEREAAQAQRAAPLATAVRRPGLRRGGAAPGSTPAEQLGMDL